GSRVSRVPVSVRSTLKACLEAGLVRSGVTALRRAAHVRHALVLSYHAVVPLEQLLAPAPPGRRPRVAITFDDGYRGAVCIGVPELARRDVPATLFVVPGFVGKGPFWWDAVAPGARGVDPALRQ